MKVKLLGNCKRKRKKYWTGICLWIDQKWLGESSTKLPGKLAHLWQPHKDTVVYPQQLKSAVTNSIRKFSVLSWHRFFLLVQGGKSREKVVKLLASTPPEEILEKLKKQVEKK